VRVVVCLHAPRPGEGELGRDDARALAHALALGPQHQVTVVLAGGPGETAPLTRALGAGAKRAVRFSGEDFATADFHTLGQALAAGIKRLGADLVLTGARSDDDGLGAVPASAARHLGFPHVACIETLAAAQGEPESDAVDVTVRGGGKRRRLRVPLPALLSVAGGPGGPFAPPETTGNTSEIETVSLVDPEATVVRRRTELLGQPELALRGTEQVDSAARLVDALTRR
jgi:electron transfer flavoprotein alpha/beta subunit